METRQHVYSIVYHSLMVGMAVSCTLFAVGVFLQLMDAAGRHLYDAEPVMKMGVIAMILTPISRVVVSIFAFAADRDYRFVAITLAVLGSIAASILLGMHGV